MNQAEFFREPDLFNSPMARLMFESESEEVKQIIKRMEFARTLYPEQQRSQLDLQLRDGRKFRGAVWELYLAEQLHLAGCEIQYESRIPNNRKSIDFSWEKDNTTFRVEATSKSLSHEAEKVDMIQATLYDEIASRVSIRTRSFRVNVVTSTTANPDIELICAELQALYQDHSGNPESPQRQIKDPKSGWEFSFGLGELFLKPTEFPVFYFGPAETDVISPKEYQEVITFKKPKFIGADGGINIIALAGAHSFPPNIFEAVQIFYGNPAVQFNVETKQTVNTILNPGFFHPGFLEYEDISAFVLGFGSLPGFASSSPVLVCLNPNARTTLEPSMLPFEAQYLRISSEVFEFSDRAGEWKPVAPWGDRFSPGV